MRGGGGALPRPSAPSCGNLMSDERAQRFEPADDARLRAPAIGATIGHYQIVAKVGEGGMGQVFRAHDPRLGRFVAIKVIAAGLDDVAEGTMRLVREARAASALNHPNIITVYDIGTLPDTQPETPFVVMEFIDGRTLKDVIRERSASFKQRLGYAVQIAGALNAAHAAGIVHRDIKPANVMLNSAGLVKVLDFGLARHVASEAVTAASPDIDIDSASTRTAPELVTKAGYVVGTFAYASPEQVESQQIDARSDIFSFGILLYELLAGVRPFEGTTPIQLTASVLRQEPRPVSELCPEAAGALEAIVHRCLQKKPAQRFQHAAEIRDALEEVRNAQTASQAAAPPAQSGRMQIAVAAAAVLVAGAAAAYVWLNRAGPPPAPLMAAPLTSYVGVERAATFSPDGSQFAFSWNGEDGNNADIYVRPTKEGRYLRLTSHAHADESPAWSPDGQYIAFRRLEPGFGIEMRAKAQLILVPPLGGAERVIAEGDLRNVRWTADSREIAVSSLISPPEEEPNRSRYAIELISVETGARRRLTHPPASLRGDADFAFSPDGKWIAVMRFGPSPSTDILVLPAGGGQERLLAHENVWTGGVAWTPDSRDLIYASSWDGRRRLFRIAAVPGSGAGQKPSPVAGIEPDASAPSLFPGSANVPAALAFERHASDASIWRYDLTKEGGNGRRLIDSTWPETSPSAAPDGAKLVFASMRSGISELWTADGKGHNQTQLTRVAGSSGSPRWSPVDDRIVFDSFVGDNKEIFVIGAAGQNLVRLTNEPNEEARPNWSPDGKWVYFRSRRSGSAQIWRTPSAGGGAPVQVTFQGGAEPIPSWDGQWLYYIRDRRVPQVWRVPAAGGEESKFLDGPFYGYWGVTRDSIVYLDHLAQPDGSRWLRFYDLKGGKAPRASARVGGDINTTVPGLSVTPDGRLVLLLQVEKREADLFLVRPFH